MEDEGFFRAIFEFNFFGNVEGFGDSESFLYNLAPNLVVLKSWA